MDMTKKKSSTFRLRVHSGLLAALCFLACGGLMAATDFEPQLTLRAEDPSWTVEDLEAKPGIDPQHHR